MVDFSDEKLPNAVVEPEDTVWGEANEAKYS